MARDLSLLVSEDKYIKVAEGVCYRRAYSDTVDEYNITAKGFTEDEILEYCKTKVSRCKTSYEDSNREWYETYYEFHKNGFVDDNGDCDIKTYKYRITAPYLD